MKRSFIYIILLILAIVCVNGYDVIHCSDSEGSNSPYPCNYDSNYNDSGIFKCYCNPSLIVCNTSNDCKNHEPGVFFKYEKRSQYFNGTCNWSCMINESIYLSGWKDDSDGDLIADQYDQCPGSKVGQTVDQYGCTCTQKESCTSKDYCCGENEVCTEGTIDLSGSLMYLAYCEDASDIHNISCSYEYGSDWWCASLDQWESNCSGSGQSIYLDGGRTCNSQGDRYCVTCIDDDMVCNETDDGRDPYHKGYVIGYPSEIYDDDYATDYCINHTITESGHDDVVLNVFQYNYSVREYYLNNTCEIVYEDIKCDFRCLDGECIDVYCKDGQLIGDVDDDGEIDSWDTKLMMDIIYNDLKIPTDICCLDINKDGNITEDDRENMWDYLLHPEDFNDLVQPFGKCTIKCNETDDGIDQYTKGTVYGKPSVNYSDDYATDYCTHNVLREFYLNSACEIFYDDIRCTIGCVNGTCIPVTSDTCNETDDGFDIYNKGSVDSPIQTGGTDYCISRFNYFGKLQIYDPPRLLEYFCGSDGQYSTEIINCTYGCYDGACRSTPQFYCNDSDSDKDDETYYKGTTTLYYSNGSIFSETTDWCSGDDLQESVCCDDGTSKCMTYVNCPNGCYEGACVKNDSCTDYDGGNEPYIASHAYGKGTAGYFVDANDECFTDSTGTVRVVEYTCKDDINLQAWSVECPNGCVDGACVDSCTDTDDGDLFVAGTTTGYTWSPVFINQTITSEDRCLQHIGGRALSEMDCESTDELLFDNEYPSFYDTISYYSENEISSLHTWRRHECPYLCVDGACVSGCDESNNWCDDNRICNDSDGGIKGYTRGVIYFDSDFYDKPQIREDYCGDENVLIEYYCDDIGVYNSRSIFCECEDGACLNRTDNSDFVEVTSYSGNLIGYEDIRDDKPKLIWQKDDVNYLVSKDNIHWSNSGYYKEPIWDKTTKKYEYPTGRVKSDYPAFSYCEDYYVCNDGSQGFGDPNCSSGVFSEDWRLPTREEFNSVADLNHHEPPKTYLPGLLHERYWTSDEGELRDVNGNIKPIQPDAYNFYYSSANGKASKTMTYYNGMVRCVTNLLCGDSRCDSHQVCKTYGDYPTHGEMCCIENMCSATDGCFEQGKILSFEGNSDQQIICDNGTWADYKAIQIFESNCSKCYDGECTRDVCNDLGLCNFEDHWFSKPTCELVGCENLNRTDCYLYNASLGGVCRYDHGFLGWFGKGCHDIENPPYSGDYELDESIPLTDWPMANRDSKATNNYPGTIDFDLDLIGYYEFDDYISDYLIDEDKIFVLFQNKIKAIDQRTKRMYWEFESGGSNGGGYIKDPFIYKGVIYFNSISYMSIPGSSSKTIYTTYALNTSSGKIIWSEKEHMEYRWNQKEYSSGGRSMNTYIADEDVLYGSIMQSSYKEGNYDAENYLFAKDAKTGKILWEKELPPSNDGYVKYVNNMLMEDDILYINLGSEILSYDIDVGRFKMYWQNNSYYYGNLAVADGKLITCSNSIKAVDPINNKNWEHPVPGSYCSTMTVFNQSLVYGNRGPISFFQKISLLDGTKLDDYIIDIDSINQTDDLYYRYDFYNPYLYENSVNSLLSDKDGGLIASLNSGDLFILKDNEFETKELNIGTYRNGLKIADDKIYLKRTYYYDQNVSANHKKDYLDGYYPSYPKIVSDGKKIFVYD